MEQIISCKWLGLEKFHFENLSMVLQLPQTTMSGSGSVLVEIGFSIFELQLTQVVQWSILVTAAIYTFWILCTETSTPLSSAPSTSPTLSIFSSTKLFLDEDRSQLSLFFSSTSSVRSQSSSTGSYEEWLAHSYADKVARMYQ